MSFHIPINASIFVLNRNLWEQTITTTRGGSRILKYLVASVVCKGGSRGGSRKKIDSCPISNFKANDVTSRIRYPLNLATFFNHFLGHTRLPFFWGKDSFRRIQEFGWEIKNNNWSSTTKNITNFNKKYGRLLIDHFAD